MPSWKQPNMDASIKRGAEVGESVPLFKPKSGERGRFADTWIRILPIREDSPFEEFYYWAAVHFPPGQGGMPFICGRKMFDTYGPPFNPVCPACDVAVYGAESEGVSKWYAVMNVVVVGEDGQPEDDGRVLIWACPRTVLNDLLAEVDGLPAEQKDITNPETGLAVRVRRKGSGKKDTRYEISLADAAIPLEEIDDLAEGLHDITATYRVLEPSAVSALLGEGGDPFEGSPAPSSRPRLRAAAEEEEEEEATEGEFRVVDPGEGEEPEEPEEPEEAPAPKPKAKVKPKATTGKSEGEAKSELKKKLQSSK